MTTKVTKRETVLMVKAPEWPAARADVDRLAFSIQKSDRNVTMSQARAEVWRVNPDLKQEVRAAQARERASDSAGDRSGATISDRVRQVIDEAAAQASLRPLMESWGRGMSREEVVSKVRVEMWCTPDGQALRGLDRAVGSKPYTSTAVAEIRKSRDGSQFAKALEVLDRGLRLPG